MVFYKLSTIPTIGAYLFFMLKFFRNYWGWWIYRAVYEWH